MDDTETGLTGSTPVTLSIPADRNYVVLVRSAAGHLGARAGLSLAELADLRLAVDEACGLLLLPDEIDATGDVLECVFHGADGVLQVSVAAEARPGSKPQIGGFGWTLLSALVDELDWADEGGRVRIGMLVRPRGAARSGGSEWSGGSESSGGSGGSEWSGARGPE